MPARGLGQVSLTAFVWRFFTGHPIDGMRRTNAGWFTRGDYPPHRVNWWTAKPRIVRMGYRWAAVGIPSGWLYGYLTAPVVRVNVMVWGTSAIAPFLVWWLITTLIGRSEVVHTVRVTEHAQPRELLEANDDLDPVLRLTEMVVPVEAPSMNGHRKAGNRS